MDSKRFKELLDELDGNSLETLKEKNGRYAQNGDCLHNFRKGAEIIGGTPAQACWGYLTKHLVALRDMVENNDFSNREDFLEKCQDTINYIRFLWCIGNDEQTESYQPNANEMEKAVYKECAEALATSKDPQINKCIYMTIRDGERLCLGTKEIEPFPGYDKCEHCEK